MKENIGILCFILFTLNCFGQCKDGFTIQKHDINGRMVKLPCIDFNKAAGLELRIKENVSDTNSIRIDIEFINQTDSPRTIYWYDFDKSWGIPLNFSFSVTDTMNKVIWDKLFWSAYMEPHVYNSKKAFNQEIIVEPESHYKKTVSLWWPGMTEGYFKVTVYYGTITPIIESNTIIIKNKKSTTR